MPISYELTAANVADVLLVRELLEVAGLDEGNAVRKLFGDLAYRSRTLGKELAALDTLLATEGASRRPAIRQQVEVCLATLKRTFVLGETLATTLVGLATRVAAKETALYLQPLRQQAPRETAGAYQGAVDLTSSQHSSSDP